MALFSFFGTQKEEVSIVLDIGSGSVGVSVVAFRKKQRPEVLYTTREDIAHYEHPGFDRFFHAMLNTLEIATVRLHREAFEKNGLQKFRANDIKHIHCILASPWYNATTKILIYERKVPFVVTESVVDDLVEQSLVEKKEDEHMGSAKEVAPTKIIERKVVQILLNGYETSKPYGQNVSRVEVALFTSSVVQAIGSRIQGVVRKTWLNRKILFHSFALASFMVTRDLFPKDDNFMLIDITGEVTDIFFSKSGVLLETSSTPYGKNSVLRDIARTMRTTPGEALSRLRQYTANTITKEASEKVAAALLAAKAKWISYFETVLSYVIETESIPHTVYVMADPDVGPTFSTWVASNVMGQKKPGAQQYQVTYLTEKILDERVSFKTAKERDFFIGIESAFINVLLSLPKQEQ